MSELNNRELELIKVLTEASDYLPVHVIAERLKISTKTIYRDIEKLTSKRSDLIFEKKRGKGIKLNISKISLNTLQIQKVSRYSIEERRIKMLFRLLRNSKNFISIESLSEKYYVSKSSIVNDLNYISTYLLGDTLSIAKTRQGTKIVGEEKDIRAKIVSLMDTYSFISDDEKTSEYYSERINSATIKELSAKFDVNKLEKIEYIVNKYEGRLPYTVGDLYYTNLVVHILIAIERIKSGNYIDVNENKVGTDENYYREAVNIAKSLEEEFAIKFPKSEIYYIYQYLVSTGVGEINYGNSIPVEQNIEDIANRFLANINSSNLFKIDKNEHIYYVFKLHIRALIKRLKYNIEIKNPLAEKIKLDYKDIFLAVKNLAKETLSNNISDDEVAYLTVYVQSILEDNISHKNVVLVCHSGFGTSQFLKKRLETIFTKLNIVDVVSSRELKGYNLKNVDYIISTVKLDIEYKNIINVNVLLVDEDINLINKTIFGE
ncbi:PRD domain-containing protein [Gemella sp. zg-1178]|uniref:BglG family transcription antiterminator n=1 Tax=Gemella sp. zg-1178 TaxID=2840372 RepID=UPI001C050B3F|nr:PRD domain-containing protein [Gemella sp. zg-1178]MBU0279189.1 PRD domain-containing protein [Gemella sp. zg-1178]